MRVRLAIEWLSITCLSAKLERIALVTFFAKKFIIHREIVEVFDVICFLVNSLKRSIRYRRGFSADLADRDIAVGVELIARVITISHSYFGVTGVAVDGGFVCKFFALSLGCSQTHQVTLRA